MSEYRNRTTGEVKTQGQWRAANPNMSLPRVWNSNVLDALNIDAVLRSPAATTTQYQTSVRDGVKKDSLGNWVEKYVARNMFADTTEDGVKTTKAEHETAYQKTLDDNVAKANRQTRDTLLSATDFYALTDVPMDAPMTTYRQALRDITAHDNWPNLANNDWPTKP
tara:strand:+ start:624 stop:1121 length:498 start_codon:yes stop_codon:yes gene_type:complete